MKYNLFLFEEKNKTKGKGTRGNRLLVIIII